MARIHTIGHSTHPIERFLELLRQHEIAVLVDVRSVPYSKWAPQFQKEKLSRSLESEGIEYVYLGRELGGRPEGQEFHDAEGHVDYELRSGAADFRAGIDELLRVAEARPTAILCAEENPARCHRRLLITPALRLRGVEVLDVRGDGSIESKRVAPQPGLFD
jgi:uncharacterized protein (DUF488 family)